jgi:hypothetical protein
VDPSKIAPASPAPPNRRKSPRLIPEVDRASGGVTRHLEHISPPSDAAPQQATRSRSMYQTHRQLRTGAGRLASASSPREASGEMLGLQAVCSSPPSLYLSTIWSAHRASADLIAGASVPGYSARRLSRARCSRNCFRNPPPRFARIDFGSHALLGCPVGPGSYGIV